MRTPMSAPLNFAFETAQSLSHHPHCLHKPTICIMSIPSSILSRSFSAAVVLCCVPYLVPSYVHLHRLCILVPLPSKIPTLIRVDLLSSSPFAFLPHSHVYDCSFPSRVKTHRSHCHALYTAHCGTHSRTINLCTYTAVVITLFFIVLRY